MMYRWMLALKKPSNKLWVTPAIWAVIAVCFAFFGRLAEMFLPANVLPHIESATLEGLLNVIASSMLSVSTFSLSIMVAAFSSASNGTTPRATELVMGDDNTRTAIASFISAFIYSIIAETALGTGFFEQNGRFVLFISTLAVLAYLIITLIRWVHTLSQLGRMGNTLGKIQEAASKAIQASRADPQMGASWQGACSHSAQKIMAGQCGYLTHIDMASLQSHAESADLHIHILARPGELIMNDTVLMQVKGTPQEASDLVNCFILDKKRSYDQDPGWGFIVLSEVGQRALSHTSNDPGTAIFVMTSMMRLLIDCPAEGDASASGKNHDRLSIEPLDCGNWIREGFGQISRDGAHIVEIGLVLQKVLAGIWRNAPEPAVSQAAAEMARLSLQRALHALSFEYDRQRLLDKHHALFGASDQCALKQESIPPQAPLA